MKMKKENVYIKRSCETNYKFISNTMGGRKTVDWPSWIYDLIVQIVRRSTEYKMTVDFQFP